MNRLHPHALVEAFVHTYEILIFPHLRGGDVRTPYPAILDAVDRAREVRTIPEQIDYKPQALGYFDSAMLALSALAHATERKASKEVIDHFIATLDRQVSNIEFALAKDVIYQQYRNPPSEV